MERFTFERTKGYKLVAVTDSSGYDKSRSGVYKNIINCIAMDFHPDEQVEIDCNYRMRMKFLQKDDGTWICRPLHTCGVIRVISSLDSMKNTD